MKYPTTPDGRYFVVRGRLWRCSDPSLVSSERTRLVAQVMAGRRSLARGSRLTESEKASAHAEVNRAKIALGERGDVWWKDGAPDYNRHKVENTPYWDWFRSLPV